MAMVSIGKERDGDNAWLYPEAAAAYKRMLAAGCPAGGITSAGRTRAQQEALYKAYRAGKGNLAARPGTSPHEFGIAMDLAEPVRTWVRLHGQPYGWVSGRVRGEPWHVEYERMVDRHIPPPPPPAPPKPAPLPNVLRSGSKGAAVATLQRELKTRYPAYAGRLKADGDFGPKTEAAVKEFQRRSGLVADGIVGPKTRAALGL